MLRIRFSALLGERRLRISDVSRDTGLNRGTLTRLYHGTAERIEVRTIEVLCQYLNCSTQDLLYVEPMDGNAARRVPPSQQTNGDLSIK